MWAWQRRYRRHLLFGTTSPPCPTFMALPNSSVPYQLYRHPQSHFCHCTFSFCNTHSAVWCLACLYRCTEVAEKMYIVHIICNLSAPAPASYIPDYKNRKCFVLKENRKGVLQSACVSTLTCVCLQLDAQILRDLQLCSTISLQQGNEMPFRCYNSQPHCPRGTYSV